MLAILQSLFDEVHIEILLNNSTSTRFQPITGVLQRSILSPFLYSIYINGLPNLLRSQSRDINEITDVIELAPAINSLLYTDDVVLIAEPEKMTQLLQTCEDHSYNLGYRWNPKKCVVVAPPRDTQVYHLYGTNLPKEASFSYLGIAIKPGGNINTATLIQHNVNKAKQSMNQISAIGANSKGVSTLLSMRFYVQMVRSQMEYGLAICALNRTHIKQLEAGQNDCVRKLYDGSRTSSTKVMLHMANQSSKEDRSMILQAKYIIRALQLPEDTLLPHIQTSASHSQWYQLVTNPLWQKCEPVLDTLDRRAFNTLKRKFLQDSYDTLCNGTNTQTISTCRPALVVDPILWLPMTRMERSQVIRWRLGRLPGGKPRPCPLHPTINLSRSHAIECLQIHRRLQMPETIKDPLSFLLNLLPLKKPKKCSVHRLLASTLV